MEWSEPCTRCGKCCQAEVCRIGTEAYGDVPVPCPALRFSDNIAACGIVETEKDSGMEPIIAASLGIGKGCCSIE